MMYTDRIEKKWGKMEHKEHYCFNCPLPFISEKALLNIVFDAEEIDVIEKLYEESFMAEIPNFLRNIYLNCNGCRLFFSSLSVYGFQRHPKDLYEPYDMIRENANNYSKMPKGIKERCKLVFFASLGGAYIFGFEYDNPSRIYMLNASDYKTEGIYPDFASFFDTFFDALFDEYDEKGYKKHPNEQDKGIPALENLTYTLITNTKGEK